ncbi:MAG: superoxide dismutase family protein [Elusimicrobia bacterium]|nr:superoxide dismutase family protein [Elusimicrobiota bacterium]
MKNTFRAGAGVLLSAALAFAGTKTDVGAARIAGTAKDSSLSGTARFEEVKGGLKLTLALSGAPSGTHALHIHEFGDCSDSGNAAGGHYNPDGAPHGNALKDGKRAHPGDLGNVTITDGKLAFEAVLPRVSLNSGRRPVAGRTIVLHEKADDFGQPVGNAGARVACGVIAVVGKKNPERK